MVQFLSFYTSKLLLSPHKNNNVSNSIKDAAKKVNTSAKVLSDEQKIKIDTLKSQLSASQSIMGNIQNGVSFLQDKNKELNELRGLSSRLEDLSTEYNKDTVSDADKKNIEDETKKILAAMNNIIKDDFSKKSASAADGVTVQLSNGSVLNLQTKILDLNLDNTFGAHSKDILKKSDNEVAIEGTLTISEILKDTDNIKKSLSEPLEAYHNEISNQLISLQVDASYENMALNSYAKDLLNLGAIDGYEYDHITKASKAILDNANEALSAQSAAINKDDVLKLLS